MLLHTHWYKHLWLLEQKAHFAKCYCSISDCRHTDQSVYPTPSTPPWTFRFSQSKEMLRNIKWSGTDRQHFWRKSSGFCSVPRRELVAEATNCSCTPHLPCLIQIAQMDEHIQSTTKFSKPLCAWPDLLPDPILRTLKDRTMKWRWSVRDQWSSFCSACSTGWTKWTCRHFCCPRGSESVRVVLPTLLNFKQHKDADRAQQVLLSFAEWLGNLWQKLYSINASSWLHTLCA